MRNRNQVPLPTTLAITVGAGGGLGATTAAMAGSMAARGFRTKAATGRAVGVAREIAERTLRESGQ